MSVRAEFCHISEYETRRPSRVTDLKEQDGARRFTAMFALTNRDESHGAATIPSEITNVEEDPGTGLLIASLVLMDMDMRPQRSIDEVMIEDGIWLDPREHEVILNDHFAHEAYFLQEGAWVACGSAARNLGAHATGETFSELDEAHGYTPTVVERALALA